MEKRQLPSDHAAEHPKPTTDREFFLVVAGVTSVLAIAVLSLTVLGWLILLTPLIVLGYTVL